MRSTLVMGFAGLGLTLLFATGALAEGTGSNPDYDKGVSLVAKGSFKEAIESFDKALQADAKNSEALVERALCKFRLGDYKNVVEDCKELISKHDTAHQVTRRQALMICAGAHNALAEYKEAIDCCNEAIKLTPKASICYTDRAFAYQQLKQYDLALKDLDEAIKLDPKHASNYQSRAAVYEALARDDRSKYHEIRSARKPGEKPWQAAIEKMKGKTATKD